MNEKQIAQLDVLERFRENHYNHVCGRLNYLQRAHEAREDGPYRDQIVELHQQWALFEQAHEDAVRPLCEPLTPADATPGRHLFCVYGSFPLPTYDDGGTIVQFPTLKRGHIYTIEEFQPKSLTGSLDRLKIKGYSGYYGMARFIATKEID